MKEIISDTLREAHGMLLFTIIARKLANVIPRNLEQLVLQIIPRHNLDCLIR